MCRFKTPVVVVFPLLILLLVGCNSGPVDPGSQPSHVASPIVQASSSNHECLGYYMLAFDTITGSVDVIPARMGEWHFNLTGILNTTMGVTATAVPGQSNPGCGIFTYDITLSHPFDTEPKFAGFDVKGILMTPGTLPVGAVLIAGQDEPRLDNADAFTRWWNPTEFTSPGMFGYTEGILATAPASALTATVNPYKAYADILGPEDSLAWIAGEPLDSDLGRAVFTAGASNTRRYRLLFPTSPTPEVVYGYAIDCAWIAPDPNPPVEIPDDFPIEANQPEAFRIVVQPTVNTLYYDIAGTASGGVLRLQINIHDWQGQYEGNIADQISGVRIYAPGMYSGGFDASFLDETPLKARYKIDLTGVAFPTAPGRTPLICQVVSADGSTYQQSTEPAPSSLLSAYHVTYLNIPDPECETDTDNQFNNASPIEFGDIVEDQVCAPEDEDDYYQFSFGSGTQLTGEIRLYANAQYTMLRLYNVDHELITEADLQNAVATIDLDEQLIMPGLNYIKVSTQNMNQVVPYVLELDAETIDVVPSNPVEVTPPTLFVKGNRIWRTHTHAILTGMWGVWVYDMADPSDPVLVSYRDYAVTNDAVILGSKLYHLTSGILSNGDVNMIDFSDPTDPVLYESIIHLPSAVRGIAVSSTHIYVGTPNLIAKDVTIYEYITDPLAPVEVGTIPKAGSPTHFGLLYPNGPNKKLVVGYEMGAIRVYDVDDPSSITQVGLYNRPPGLMTDMVTSNYSVYYTLYNSATEEGRLYVLEYNMAIPNDLAEAGWLATPGEPRDVYIWWPNAFIADGFAGMTIINVDDPSAMYLESTTPTISEARDIYTLGDLVHVIPFNAGLQIFDVSDFTAPTIIETLPVVDGPREAVIKGDYMLVAENAGTQYIIKCVDISDPPNAAYINGWGLDDKQYGLTMDGNFLANRSSEMVQLWGMSGLPSMDYFSHIMVPDHPMAIGISGKAFYIATDTPQLLVYDISDVYNPAYQVTQALTWDATDFTFYDDYMYITTEGGILVYLIDNAMSPVYITIIDPGDTIKETEIQGKYMYTVTPTTLVIYDLTVPELPVLVGSALVDAALDLTQVAVEGQYAYVDGNGSPVYAVDIWPPDSPSLIGMLYEQKFISLLGSSSDLLVRDGYLYGMNPWTGIRIHDLY